jgi:DNA adenine methylase
MIYVDPPYRGSFTNYGTGFDDNAQKRLVKACEVWKQAGNNVFLSNREMSDNFFEQLLPNSTFHKFHITYTAGRRKKTKVGFEAKPAIEILIEI